MFKFLQKIHKHDNFPLAYALCSAVDQFKKQFAYLEEHYGKGGAAAAPPERQHASSLPRY